MKSLYYIALALILLDSILGLSLLFAKRLDTKLYPIALAATVSIIEELIGEYFSVKNKNGLFTGFIFNPLEYACFAWFFYINVDFKVIKALIKVSIVIFLAFVSGYLYFFLKLKPLAAKTILDYVVATKSFWIVIWSIAYIFNIFNQITHYKKLNVYTLMVAGALLFYYSFSIIYFLSELYLINYSERHHISLSVMLNPQNAQMYASKQWTAVRPLLFLTNILLYLCIFVALVKSVVVPKKHIKASV
ncbi:hypothetical protein [Mucilaginibacter agri]|uniref:Uncharacterized protein n=1 Tax=Mucilaginibacter agri TaxID=2695265 RepID=A0A966DU55_9SPHI|nr:hypothetical protein [Mucilaginibacter agri]NCD69339.1 hypothetical protein [Mucilaginibacter agri]